MIRDLQSQAQPLGANFDGRGVSFALFSEHATQVELCLFERAGAAVEILRIPLRRMANHTWHEYVVGIRPGQLYGYRVHGPYLPHDGHRFNPHKLLLDPYARAVSGPIPADDTVYGYARGDPAEDRSFDSRDSAGRMPKCIVVDSSFDWSGDAPPRTPWEDTVLYECHVKGMTALHPSVPPEWRGRYPGLASDPVLRHIAELGITAVELLPVHHFADPRALLRRGLVNYWGYHTLGFFAPESRYATHPMGRQVVEFKEMVKAFHRAGIEVILDVVYNHTGEGDRLGRTVCFRGIDNASYYRLSPGDRREYENFTGCGNTLNIVHPRVLQLVMDSLRYWVQEMHVDGFRFDLATVLIRDERGLDHRKTLLSVIQQDPVLSHVKLIAEPWDLGPDGYQLGAFPPPWTEWNDQYRDSVRRFWRGDKGQVAGLASCLAGSSQTFARSGRGPCAGINFVTCHDGYTLHDLVSFESKHNEANGENNLDGSNHNFSRNWGVEGPTDDRVTVAMRERIKRNLLTTLACSRGVPMLCAGDEFGRTQKGNNNAYCQDSETSWLNWNLDNTRREFWRFVRIVLGIRRKFRGLRHDAYFRGATGDHQRFKDVTWLRPDGQEWTLADWNDPEQSVIAMMVHDPPNETILVLINGGPVSCGFVLPQTDSPDSWEVVLDTHEPSGQHSTICSGQAMARPQSLLLLIHPG